jgi:hypothetical protein
MCPGLPRGAAKPSCVVGVEIVPACGPAHAELNGFLADQIEIG